MQTNRLRFVFLITVMMLLFLAVSPSAYAAEPPFSVTLGEGEMLESAIDALTDDYLGVATLTVCGFISAADLSFISSEMTSLVMLDMSGAAFTGTMSISGLIDLETLCLPRPGEGGYVIAANAFYGSQALTGTLVIPSGVTSIGARAFYCEQLADIVIEEPKDLLVIKTGAFDQCDRVKSIVVHASEDKVNIGENAFKRFAGEVQFQPPQAQQPQDQQPGTDSSANGNGVAGGNTVSQSYSNQSSGASTMPIPVHRYVAETQAEGQTPEEVPMSPLEDPMLEDSELKQPEPKAKKKTAASGVRARPQDAPQVPEVEAFTGEDAHAEQPTSAKQATPVEQPAPAGREPVKPIGAEQAILNETPADNGRVDQTARAEMRPVVSGTAQAQRMPAWGYWAGAGALLAAGGSGAAARLMKMRKRRARRILHSLTYGHLKKPSARISTASLAALLWQKALK